MNSSSNSSAEQMNTVYATFNGAGFQWALFLPALQYAIMALIGVPLNATVCWVTIKNSSLRCNTCILLAVTSFFEILHQLAYFHFLIITLSGINFHPVRLALPMQSFSVIGIIAASNQVALLSLDRLFSVLTPVFYFQLEQRKYICCQLLANAAITAFYFAQIIPSAKRYPEWPCTGAIGDFFALPDVGPVFWCAGLAISCATILAYLLVGIIVKVKTEVTTERQQKIYRSLFLIVLINVGGYFSAFFANTLYKMSLLPVSQLQFWYIKMFTSGIIMNIGAMSNAPILYFNSMDYRNAYKKEFKSIPLFRNIFNRGQEQLRKIKITSVIRVNPINTIRI